MGVRVKICGIMSPDDAVMVAEAGADIIGLNFFAGPRKIEISQARLILAALPSAVTVAALVDVSRGDIPGDVFELLNRHGSPLVQMYGSAAPETVARLGRKGSRTILVAHVSGPGFTEKVRTMLDASPEARPFAVLLDAAGGSPAENRPPAGGRRHTRAGGTGTTVDWTLIRKAKAAGAMSDWPPVMLAGGLTPENVARAIAVVRPWCVDVASGVESSPGHKDATLVRAFVEAVRNPPSPR